VSVALVPLVDRANGELRAVMMGLLATLRGMVAVGHQPDDYLLVRFTDDRTKASVLPEGTLATDTLAALINEYGPVASALNVSVASSGHALLLCVTDLTSLGSPRLEQRAVWAGGSLKFEGTTWKPAAGESYSRDLRNSAIFAESLGMTTGWLPNVDRIFSPPGVAS